MEDPTQKELEDLRNWKASATTTIDAQRKEIRDLQKVIDQRGQTIGRLMEDLKEARKR